MDNLTEENHRDRSNFVRTLVQQCGLINVSYPDSPAKIPTRIVQFWDDLNQLPADVSECIETWKKTEEQGFERIMFDSQRASKFIYEKLGPRYKWAYDSCYHPAMQSDFFRLCYIFVEGGCYIDVDDVYNGMPIRHLFNDERLKVQPLCYDVASHTMVSPSLFTKIGANAASWIFYFNNNPLIAGSRHPIIGHALDQATLYLEKRSIEGLPEIQSTTGPGNLTKSIFDVATESSEIKKTLLVVTDWESIAKTKWELDYRNDQRNWRLSNCQDYKNDETETARD